MAQIVKYTAQQGLNPGGQPRAQVHSYQGTALENLGGAIESAAALFQQREEQKENFKANADKQKLDLQLAREMDDRAQQLDGDGAGFHDSFLKEVYTPLRNKFLQGLSPRLREQYEQILGDEGPDTEKWSITAASKERDQLYSWYDTTIAENQQTLANAIDMDPDAYEALLEQGLKQIDGSGLPPSRKEARRKEWEHMAQVAHLNRMIQDRPEEVLRDLGADPRTFTPTTQFALLSRAVQGVESSDDPTAISPKGAIGLMQVMPGTAKDIARWMGDEAFDPSWSDEQITEYLSNPATNKQYGDFYLKRMIRQFAKTGGLKAALIGYNAGPEVAKKWIESGFNDDVLPQETRDYVPKIMARLPAGGSELGDPVAGTKRAAKHNPANVKLQFKEQKGIGALVPQEQEKHINPDLVNRVKSSFAALGIDNVRINSGYRTEDRNRRAKGAENSQHLHGNAMDIDVSGYSRSERIRIIEALSANGITGIGVGANIIHADVGGRRVWGYKTPSGGGDVPAWAKEVTDRHLKGEIASAGEPGAGGRYSSLPYSERQKFIRAADQQVSALADSAAKADVTQKTEMRRLIADEIASLTATGVSFGNIDDTAVSTILGEEAYVRFVNDRDVAMRTFDATNGIKTMSVEEMDERLLDYTPPPGLPVSVDDQKIRSAVEREIDRVTRLRTKAPDQAAMEFEDVQQAWAAFQAEPTPEAAQEFVRLNLERQAEFGLKPGSERPLPQNTARSIGRDLSKIPEVTKGDLRDTQTALLNEYMVLKEIFGDYAEEVIIQGLAAYRNINPETAELITAYMDALNAGSDPFRSLRRAETAAEDEAVEGMSFLGRTWNTVKSIVTGAPLETDDPGPPEENTGTEPSPEAINRVITEIDFLGEDFTMTDELRLRERFGDEAVNAALAQRPTED